MSRSFAEESALSGLPQRSGPKGSNLSRSTNGAKPPSDQLTKKGHQRVFVTHDDYEDYSHETAPPGTDESVRVKLQEHLFNLKYSPLPFPVSLHLMVDHAMTHGYQHIICWQPHGRSFRVVDKDAFLSDLMPLFFKQKQFPSFCRQLQLYGFRRLAKKGPDKDSYYHRYFLRGLPHLAERMKRQSVRGTNQRPRYSPASEPDFFAMPYVCPPQKKGRKKVAPVSNLLEALKGLAARKRCDAVVDRTTTPPLMIEPDALLPGFTPFQQGGVMQPFAATVGVQQQGSTIVKQHPPRCGATSLPFARSALTFPPLPLSEVRLPPSVREHYMLHSQIAYPNASSGTQVQDLAFRQQSSPVFRCHDSASSCLNQHRANDELFEMDDWEPFFADIDLSEH